MGCKQQWYSRRLTVNVVLKCSFINVCDKRIFLQCTIMFNFASKVFNTIGDLISVEDLPKQPSQPSQPSQQPTQQRRLSGDGRFFQQKPRFQGPSHDDHLPRIGPTSGHSIRPSSTPVYRYPTHSTTSTYRPEPYEESKFKAPDIDYNEGEFFFFFL